MLTKQMHAKPAIIEGNVETIFSEHKIKAVGQTKGKKRFWLKKTQTTYNPVFFILFRSHPCFGVVNTLEGVNTSHSVMYSIKNI